MTSPTGSPRKNHWPTPSTPSPYKSRLNDTTPCNNPFTPLSPVTQRAMDFSPPRRQSVSKNFESTPTRKTNEFVKQHGPFPKSRGNENSPSKFCFADLCPEEGAFSETAGYTKNVRKAPSTPDNYKHKSRASVPVSQEERNNQDRFTTSETIWKRLAQHQEIGEGNFHKVLLDTATGIVYKIPNEKYREQSSRMKHKEPICFVHVKNAEDNYLALQRTQLPSLLKLAKTEFNSKNAIIVQEVWDRPFDPEEDLKNEKVRKTVKDMLQLLANGTINMDFRPANLGWKNGELKLFDFLEEKNNESIHTIEEFARQFATKTEQKKDVIITTINKPLYNYLLPKVRVHLR